MDADLKLGVILASTREGRRGEGFARWIHELMAQRPGVQVELLDLSSTSESRGAGRLRDRHTRVQPRVSRRAEERARCGAVDQPLVALAACEGRRPAAGRGFALAATSA